MLVLASMPHQTVAENYRENDLTKTHTYTHARTLCGLNLELGGRFMPKHYVASVTLPSFSFVAAATMCRSNGEMAD